MFVVFKTCLVCLALLRCLVDCYVVVNSGLWLFYFVGYSWILCLAFGISVNSVDLFVLFDFCLGFGGFDCIDVVNCLLVGGVVW